MRNVCVQYILTGWSIPLEIEEDNFYGLLNIGITSGASTPEILVDNFINFLKPSKINIIGTDERDINFTLPVELQ